MSNIGKTVWNREHKEKGIVTHESTRYCAVCGKHPCLIVEWEDGKKTMPCTHGVKSISKRELEIM